MSRVLPKTRAANQTRERYVHGVELSPARTEQFLAYMIERGRRAETINTYRGNLERIRAHLQTDYVIRPGSLDAVGQSMLEAGYSPNAINACFAAANSFLEYCGRRDLQVAKMQKVEETQPELTRSEYLRLLRAARDLGREREYLLIKVFATTDINIADLTKITAEAVKAGSVVVSVREGKKERLPLAAGLQKELLAYIARKGIPEGPIFRSRGGEPMKRSNINARISALAREARVSEEKCNPRCLQRLYRTTMDGIAENLSALMQQMYMQMLDKEQLEIGWSGDRGTEQLCSWLCPAELERRNFTGPKG